MYGRLRKTSFTAAAWSFGARMPIWWIDRLAPGPAARGRRAAVVEAHDDVSVLGEHLVPEVVATLPSDRATVWPAGSP